MEANVRRCDVARLVLDRCVCDDHGVCEASSRPCDAAATGVGARDAGEGNEEGTGPEEPAVLYETHPLVREDGWCLVHRGTRMSRIGRLDAGFVGREMDCLLVLASCTKKRADDGPFMQRKDGILAVSRGVVEVVVAQNGRVRKSSSDVRSVGQFRSASVLEVAARIGCMWFAGY